VHNLAVRCRVTGLVVAALMGVRVPGHAQTPPRFASPILPAQHWAVDAARRAVAVGLTPRTFAWGEGTLTQAAAGWALREASERSARLASPLADVTAGEWRRFAREFPTIAARLAAERDTSSGVAKFRTITPASASIDARFVTESGRLLPVRSLDRTRENVAAPEPLADLDDGELELRLGMLGGRYVAGELAGGRTDERWRLRDWHLVAQTRSLGAWVGERAPDFGPGAGGGLVIDGRAVFPGGGVALTSPVRAPWVFRRLGYISGEAFLSRIDSSAATRHPWVFASHLSLSPHARLLIGATQAFMFSGEGLPPFTFRNFKEMFLTHGIKTAGSEFENGIASVEARWRPPLPVVPVVLYAEWGTDDNKGAWFKFPAVVAGVSVPSVPGVPALSLGLERTSFAKPCSSCNGCACEFYATWYRHYVFMDGWTLDRQPIGHPLGGDGTEWLMYSRYDDAPRRIRLDARAFARDRGRYNLFAPTREGRSLGGGLAADYRLTDAFELRVGADVERGRREWSASSLRAGVRWVP
jgi:hypothetical protein